MEDLKIISCTEDCLSIISEESIRIKGSDTREYNISTSKYKIGKSRTITNKGSDGTAQKRVPPVTVTPYPVNLNFLGVVVIKFYWYRLRFL